jgi:hypothetical protein
LLLLVIELLVRNHRQRILPAANGARRDAPVERGEPRSLGHREAEQIDIGELPRYEVSGGRKQSRIVYRNVVRDECRVGYVHV